ncbi:MAG: hypothetical protein B7Y36_15520 [Novosphingobium sp. 28-62-57]|nr:MAG: hypothetical protein B7Z36_00650 [Novosphingobium sp. 12-63-9]OYZ08962.1 MAG: hypothetical protein B7Y36_15520 [Novosphingobium sp. 28-62-57]OYZ99028.1 MAG: hypothetical protein B7X96_00260 [Novosphingobium sp. 17-62-8]
MGQEPAFLLVRRFATLVLAAALVGGCEEVHAPPRVDAKAYDAIYVWPGVKPAPDIAAKTVYLLDGEVRREGAVRLERLRLGVPRLPGRTVWLVVRAERLDWTAATYAAILTDLQRWREAGNAVAGVQIDFDAATRGIEGYAAFLKRLRARLPEGTKLSITGLMDWSANGDPRALAGLAQTVDEVVVQTYQGRTTIPGYDAYFAKMADFPIPFRVALVEGGEWQAPAMLKTQPQFRGYVVFLLAPKR